MMKSLEAEATLVGGGSTAALVHSAWSVPPIL
jgi:hypothetical protein